VKSMLETVSCLLDTLVVKIVSQPVLLQRQMLATINSTLKMLMSGRFPSVLDSPAGSFVTALQQRQRIELLSR